MYRVRNLQDVSTCAGFLTSMDRDFQFWELATCKAASEHEVL